jgi:hypothetical protein
MQKSRNFTRAISVVLFERLPKATQKNRFAMLNANEVTIEVPKFDVPLILASNAALWVVIIALGATVF